MFWYVQLICGVRTLRNRLGFIAHDSRCPSTGHTRPLSILVARMAKLRPISITFVVAAKYLKGAKAEISRELTLCGEDVQKRIRLDQVPEVDSYDAPH